MNELTDLIKEIQNRLWASGGGEVIITHNKFTVNLDFPGESDRREKKVAHPEKSSDN